MVSNSNLKEKIIETTLAVYRVTDKFPKGEILREKIRERALDFIGQSFALFFCVSEKNEQHNNLVADVEVLRAYFDIARIQNLVDPGNFEVLEEEYCKIMDELQGTKELHTGKRSRDLVKAPRFRRTEQPTELKERDRAIVDYFRNNGSKMRVGELSSVFSGLSKRTIRRDVEKLCQWGVLERIGSHNETAYRLKENLSLVGQN